MYKPKPRSTRLLVEELVDELLIYDVERNEVHCLNGAAVRVWQLCDGERTVPEIARDLNSDFDPDQAETLVWSALDQFAERHLLEEVEAEPLEVHKPEGMTPLEVHKPEGMTRRQMLLRVSMVVGLLPLVDSIVSPEAALAQSMGMSTPTTPTTPTPP
jgi:Coenzyme PQQ synthesis protein D (PqqD)